MDNSLYTRPDKPTTKSIKRRYSNQPAPVVTAPAEPLMVDARSECHVTPADVAARMVDYLDASSEMLTLEPQAGTGALVQALLDSGHPLQQVVAIERHSSLFTAVYRRMLDSGGANAPDPSHLTVLNECFLAYAARVASRLQYPRIVMNPPFKDVRHHMKAALSLLSKTYHPNAVLVALVPVTYHHDDAELLETLDDTTFPLAKVNTKLIRIIRT